MGSLLATMEKAFFAMQCFYVFIAAWFLLQPFLLCFLAAGGCVSCIAAVPLPNIEGHDRGGKTRKINLGLRFPFFVINVWALWHEFDALFSLHEFIS